MTTDEILQAAVEKKTTAERDAYLDAACGADVALRALVEGLLQAHDAAGSFLEQPLFEPRPTACELRKSEKTGVIIGPYKLLDQIGEGGMGTVFMAKQTQPVQRRVALKIIKAGMDSRQVVARFEAERQALALMDHVNISRVFDGGATENGRPYFVMELVHGVPITKYCDDNHLTPRERLELFVPVCQAIQHAHQKGIIHRDIKPSNVMVTLYDGRPVPKVIDFGVAKATEQKLTERTLFTQYGAVVGTLEYMSPEQAEMSALGVDTRSDIYSLGVLLYELLTGSTPLTHKRMKEVAYAEIVRLLKEEEPPKPSTRLLESGDTLVSIAAQRHMEPAKLTKLVRGELDWIVMKALEKDRNRRYETANGLALDVQRYLADEPVQACPPAVGYRLRKFVRKNKRLALAVSVVVLALLGGIVGTSAGLVQAEHARWAAAERAEGEREAKELAEKRLVQVEKGIELVGSIFQDLDPRSEKKAGKSLRVLLGERLGAIANQLETESVGDPVAVARLQRMLGRSLHRLGYSEKAIPLLLKARETLTIHLGLDNEDTLRTTGNLALAYTISGRLDLALPLHQESFRIAKSKYGPDHAVTLTCTHNLASCYRSSGKRDLAIPLFEETLKRRKAKFGPDDTQTLSTMNSLGVTYREAGKPELAIPLLEATLKLREVQLGRDHEVTCTVLNNLALACQDVGKMDLALRLFEEVVTTCMTKLGPNHPNTVTAISNLAGGYYRAGEPEQALPLLQQAAAAIEKRQFVHVSAWQVLFQLSHCCEQLKKYEQGEIWRRKWLAVLKKKDGPESSVYARELAYLGMNLIQQKKWLEAETTLRQCLAIRQRKEADAWTTFNTQSLVGGALLGQQKHADAEPLLLQGYDGMNKRLAKIPTRSRIRLTQALDRLVQCYDAWGPPDAAAKWRKRLKAQKSK